MIRHSLLAVAGLLAGVQAAGAQSPFEGIVTLQFTTPGSPPMETALHVKGNRMRSEMSMGGMPVYSIVDIDKGSVVAVLPAQRMYMSQNMSGLPARADTTATRIPDVKFEATGRKGTFAGMTCEYYHLVFDAGNEADACIAKGAGTFLGMGAPAGPRSNRPVLPPGMREFARKFKDGAFILKMDFTTGQTKGMSMEVTKVEKKQVDDAIFAVPEGFQDMSGMMPNLPGRRPPARD